METTTIYAIIGVVIVITLITVGVIRHNRSQISTNSSPTSTPTTPTPTTPIMNCDTDEPPEWWGTNEMSKTYECSQFKDNQAGCDLMPGSCNISCGRCPGHSVPSPSIPPSGDNPPSWATLTCAEIASYGGCSQPGMDGFCLESCASPGLPIPSRQPIQHVAVAQHSVSGGHGRKIGIVLAGQSNAGGSNVDYAQSPAINNKIKVWNRTTNTFEVASDPLPNFMVRPNSVGFALTFCNKLYENGTINQHDELYIFPEALNGAGVLANAFGPELLIHVKNNTNVPFRWNQNGIMPHVKNDIDAGKRMVTSLDIQYILWNQGETDMVHCKMGCSQYIAELKVVFALLRTYVQNSRATILAGTLTENVANDSMKTVNTDTRKHFNINLTGLANSDQHTHIVDLKNQPLGPDKIHYTAATQRIVGQKYAEKAKTLTMTHI
jgi:hypothetical protein